MQTSVDNLPISLQKLFYEVKAEQDAIEASKNDYVEIAKEKFEPDKFEELDDVINAENADDDFDEYDENTFDMNCLSSAMREVFD